MNKIINPKSLPLATAIAGLLGFGLRIWTLSGGTDREGLYTFQLLPWVLLWIVTAALPVLIILMSKPLKEPVKFAENYPPSIISAMGSLLGALGIALSAWDILQAYQRAPFAQDTLALLTALLGFVAAVLMALVAYFRLKGNKPNFLCHVSVCLYLALKIFHQCKAWSNEPQISVFLFPFLAELLVMLAAYHLSTFDADLGKRPASLLWSLWAVYLCLVALPDTNEILFYGLCAIWLMTNICSLRPAKKRKAATQEPTKSVQAQMSSSDVSLDELKTWLDEE